MKAPLPFCLALAVLVLGAGCVSSPKSRIAKNQAAFDAYPADVQAALRKGEVKISFTPEQVRIALGAPDRVLTRTGTDGQSEIWVTGMRIRVSGSVSASAFAGVAVRWAAAWAWGPAARSLRTNTCG